MLYIWYMAWFIRRVKLNPVSVICWCKPCCISWALSQWLLTHLSLNGCWCSSNDPGDWNRLRSRPSMVSAPGSRWQNWAWLLWLFLTWPHWWSWSSLKLLSKIALFFKQKKFNLSLLFYWNLIYCILYNAFKKKLVVTLGHLYLIESLSTLKGIPPSLLYFFFYLI